MQNSWGHKKRERSRARAAEHKDRSVPDLKAGKNPGSAEEDGRSRDHGHQRDNGGSTATFSTHNIRAPFSNSGGGQRTPERPTA